MCVLGAGGRFVSERTLKSRQTRTYKQHLSYEHKHNFLPSFCVLFASASSYPSSPSWRPQNSEAPLRPRPRPRSGLESGSVLGSGLGLHIALHIAKGQGFGPRTPLSRPCSASSSFSCFLEGSSRGIERSRSTEIYPGVFWCVCIYV